MKKIIRIIVFIVLIGGFGWWNLANHYDSQSVRSGAKPVVKIGVLLPLTGNNADLGAAAKAGILTALQGFKNTNKAYQYKVLFEDTQNKASSVSILANKLINADKADVVISFLIGNAKIVAPIAEKAGVLHLSVSLENKNFERFGKTTFVQGTAVEDMQKKIIDVLKNNKINKIAIIAADVGVSALAANQLKISAQREGVKSIVERFNPGERDFRILIEKLKDDGFKYFYISAFPPETDVLIRQMNKAGIKNNQILGQGIDTGKNNLFYEGIRCFGLNSGGKAFSKRITSEYHLSTVYGASITYDLINLVVKVYEKLYKKDKKPDIQKIVKSIHNLSEYECLSGQCKVLPNGFIINPPAQRKYINGQAEEIEQ